MIDLRYTAIGLGIAAALAGVMMWLGAPWFVAIPAGVFGLVANGVIATFLDDDD